MSAKKKLEFNRKQKLLKRRQQKLASYYKNRSKKNAEYTYTNTKEATKKRAYRAKKAEKKEKENIRKRNYRQAMKSKHITQNTLDDRDIFKNVFNNRTTKHIAIKRLKNALPRTPKRRSATLAAYLQHTKSPAVEILRQAEVVSSPEDQMDMAIEKAALEDIKTAIDSCKTKRSKDSVTSMNVLVASISGEKVTETRCRKNLAKKIGLPVRRLSRENRIRTTILKSEKS
ncbi:unnamed protein product [Mytilus coruscus]|uniref:Uncharacterized protein n=1 Tax=Mytilus coruscus TaxID=42192 RepID=A0A6J8B162_MYTCO|nr:unnamed protein product [Mytilus coruscus]